MCDINSDAVVPFLNSAINRITFLKLKNVNPVLEKIVKILPISGVLIIKDDHIGLAGELPELIKIDDSSLTDKITVDKDSNHAICLS